MNIFAVHDDPTSAAQSLHDRHVVKMVLESAQMLCTVAVQLGLQAPYKATHAKHPCVIWAGQTASNAEWLARHALALCAEYTHRFGRRHKSQDVIVTVAPALLDALPEGPLMPFAQAMPDPCKRPDPVDGYREYYRQHKLAGNRWTNRDRPAWAA